MKPGSALVALAIHLAVVSAMSFGGFPTVLPDVHAFVVTTHGWLTDQDFADTFAMAQAIPGPNLILMMGLIGWHVAGLPGAVAAATATFAPPCAIYFGAFRFVERYRGARWQRILAVGLVPLTTGLIVASGAVMAQTADETWIAGALTIAAALAVLMTRINPLWLVAVGGALGGMGFLG